MQAYLDLTAKQYHYFWCCELMRPKDICAKCWMEGEGHKRNKKGPSPREDITKVRVFSTNYNYLPLAIKKSCDPVYNGLTYIIFFNLKIKF